MANSYDLIIIGTGPGGEGAAMMAAKHGKSVAAIESFVDVGGGCTHWGTIPSKALRHAVQRYKEFSSSPLFNELGSFRRVTYPELLRTADAVIAQQVGYRRHYYERNRVSLYHGQARFVAANTVEVIVANGARERLQADKVIIATGSRPYRPDNVDFSHSRVHDSDSILRVDETPHSITIYGAGVIGCEYASIFANLGVKVNLVNTQSRLLSFLDDEITDALSYHMRDQGVIVRHRETYESVECRDSDVVLHLSSGKQLKSDMLLWANGRTGNSENLGLEHIGIVPNSRGQIDVDQNYQTSAAGVYAVGDVSGPPALASAAYDQGRFAATHIVFGECNHNLFEYIPTGIYTLPEISSVGSTESELTNQAIPYEVGHALFKHLARAQMTDQTVGMLKLLFHRETLEILGIHCFGDRASEIVHIGQAVMANKAGGNNLNYFINTTFNYPTMAEAYRVAALNGLNRLA